MFATVIALTELFRLALDDYSERETAMWAGWVMIVTIISLSLTRAYRGHANDSSPFEVALFGPIWTILICSWIRLAALRSKKASRILTFKERIPLGMGALTAVVGLVFSLLAFLFILPSSKAWSFSVYQNFLSPLGKSRLMESVMELKDMSLKTWLTHHSFLPIAYIGGTILMIYRLSRKIGLEPWYMIAGFELLMMWSFYHQKFGMWFDRFYPWALLLSGLMFAVTFLRSSGKLKALKEKTVDLFWLTYFLVTLLMSRGANRYDFFFVAPASVISAELLIWLISRNYVPNKAKIGAILFNSFALITSYLTISKGFARYLLLGFSLSCAVGALIWLRDTRRLVSPLMSAAFMWGSFTMAPMASLNISRSLQPLASVPLREAMEWMRKNLPKNAVVVARWDYGSQINVLARRSTVIDEDHYLPYWIYLTYRHVFCAQSEREALEFLKTRNATHLILTKEDLKSAQVASVLGSNENFDRAFRLIPLELKGSIDKKGLLSLIPIFPTGQSKVKIRRVDMIFRKGRFFKPKELENVYLIEGNRRYPVKYTWIDGKERVNLSPEAKGAVILFRSRTRFWRGFLTSDHGYNSLLIQLFLKKETAHFKLIYDNNGIYIWRVEYPKGIAQKKEYMVRHFPEGKLKESWMLGRIR